MPETALTIDNGWHDVAQTALAFVQRFTGAASEADARLAATVPG